MEDHHSDNSASISTFLASNYFDYRSDRPLQPQTHHDLTYHQSQSATTPPTSPAVDDKTIHVSPSPFQRLYRQIPKNAASSRTHLQSSQNTITNLPSTPAIGSVSEGFEADDHHLSSIANDTESNPAFGFDFKFSSPDHSYRLHTPQKTNSAAHPRSHSAERTTDECTPSDTPHRPVSAPPFNKSPSFISFNQDDEPAQSSSDLTRPMSSDPITPPQQAHPTPPSPNLPPQSSVLPHKTGSPLPASTGSYTAWQSYLVKTPSKLQFSYTPSSPSNTTASDQQPLSLANSSHLNSHSLPDNSFVGSDLSSLKRDDHSLESHAASNENSPDTTPLQLRLRNEYQRTFIDSPKSDNNLPNRLYQHSTAGEVRILNQQTDSIISNFNGQSLSKLQDQTFPHLNTNQSFGLDFSSPVGLKDWSIRRDTLRGVGVDEPTQALQINPVKNRPSNPDPIASDPVKTGTKVVTEKPSSDTGPRHAKLESDYRNAPAANSRKRTLPDPSDMVPNHVHTQDTFDGVKDDSNIFDARRRIIEPLPSFSPLGVPEPRRAISQPEPGWSRDEGPESPLATRQRKFVGIGPHSRPAHEDISSSISAADALFESTFGPSSSTQKMSHTPFSPIRRPLTPLLPDTSSGFIEIHVPKASAQARADRVPHTAPAAHLPRYVKTTVHEAVCPELPHSFPPAQQTPQDVTPVVPHIVERRSVEVDEEESLPLPQRSRPLVPAAQTSSRQALTTQPGRKNQLNKKWMTSPAALIFNRFFDGNSPQPSLTSDVSDVSVYYSPESTMAMAGCDTPDTSPEPHSAQCVASSIIELDDQAHIQGEVGQGDDARFSSLVKDRADSVACMDAPPSHRYQVLMSVAESLQQELSIKNEMLRLLVHEKDEVEKAKDFAVATLDDLKGKVKQAAVGQKEDRLLQTQKIEAIVNKLSSEISSLNMTSDVTASKWTISSTEAIRLKSQFEEARAFVMTFQPVLESYRESNIQLQEQTRHQAAEIVSCRKKITQLSEEIDQLRRVPIHEMEKQPSTVLQNSSSHVVPEKQMKEWTRMAKELESKSSEIVKLKTRYSELEIRHNDHLKRVAKLELLHDDRVRELQQASHTAEVATRQLENKVKELESVLKKSKQTHDQEHQGLRTHIETLTKQLADSTESRTVASISLEDHNKILQEEQKVITDSLVDLRTQIDGLRAEKRQMGQKLESAKQDNQKLIKELHKSRADHEHETQEARAQIKKIEETSNGRLESFQHELQAKEVEIEKLQASLKQARSDQEARDKERVEQITSAAHDEIEELRAKVAKITAESAAREIKVVAVRKTRTALQEDIIGLNIALEAKQQEIAFLKRDRRMRLTRSTATTEPDPQPDDPRSRVTAQKTEAPHPEPHPSERTGKDLNMRSRPSLVRITDLFKPEEEKEEEEVRATNCDPPTLPDLPKPLFVPFTPQVAPKPTGEKTSPPQRGPSFIVGGLDLGAHHGRGGQLRLKKQKKPRSIGQRMLAEESE